MMNILLKILISALSYLPLRVLYVISDFMFLFIFYIIKYRRKVVKQNLKNSFPGKTDKELNKIERKFYHHFSDLIFEIIKLTSISEGNLRERVIFTNPELFEKYKEVSIVLAVSHYGNWEWGISGISLNTEQKMMGVYKKLNNLFFNDFMNKNRAKFGADLVEINETFRYLIKNKNNPKIIGLLADQSPTKNDSNYWTTFLNQETSVYLGPEKISKKFNYPVLFCSMKKVKRGYYEVFIEELCTNPEKTTEGEITSLYLQKAEEKIKENPEFWLWTHRRWKHKR